MNILLINDWVSNRVSGGTYRIQGFAQGFRRLGHRVFIATQWGIIEYGDGIDMHHPQVPSPQYFITGTLGVFINAVNALIRSHGVDLAIVQMPSPVTKGLLIAPLLHSKGIPIVFDFGDPWWSRGDSSIYLSFANWILRKQLKHSVISSSSKLLLKMLNEATDGIRTIHIPNGVDEELFKPHGNYDYGLVGFTGRFIERNGSRLIVPILRELVRRGYDVKFLLIGDGEDLPLIIKGADKLGLRNRLIVKGPLPRKELPIALSRAMILVAPYSNDPMLHLIFPTKVPEMMALKRPVVTAKLYEIITSFNVGSELLAVEYSVEKYVNAVSMLIMDEDMYRLITHNGYVKSFTLRWRVLMANLLNYIWTN